MKDEVHPLAGLRLEAVVDWVELCIRLPHPSQARHVRERMPEAWHLPYAKPEGDRNSSRTFTIRVQDPQGPDIILVQAQALCRPGHDPIKAGDIDVVGIEVSIDAYDGVGDFDRLAEVAHYFQWHQGKPPMGGVRITEVHRGKPPEGGGGAPERRHYRAAARPADVLSALRAGFTVNAGAKNADYCARYYVKWYDTQRGQRYKGLSKEDWRARYEVTLVGDAVPFRDLAGWRAFRFEALAAHFALRRSTVDRSDTWRHMLHKEQGRLGRPDSDKKRAAHRRQTAVATRADTDANKRIRNCLRQLTRAQKCGNSGNQLAPSRTPLIGRRPLGGARS
jgi:hypothetical protein